jgi:hypothetical protein
MPASIDIPADSGTPRRPSSIDLDASSELGAAMAADDEAFGGAVAASFATQMAMAMAPLGLGLGGASGTGGSSGGGKGSAGAAASAEGNARMSRLMLAKMKTLEESLGEVVREVRSLRVSSGLPSTAHNSGDEHSWRPASWVGPGDRTGSLRRTRTSGGSSLRTRTAKRVASRKSLRDDKGGSEEAKSGGSKKDKGKAVMRSDESDNGDDHATQDRSGSVEDFTKKGSSF